MGKGYRPENTAPPEQFYNEEEALKYTNNTRIINVQAELANRCLELLMLKDNDPKFILDVGCGSGISGETLTENGHFWVGLDISRDMMKIAQEKEVEGDLFECDLGQGFSFRPGCFDHAISVSVVQWLCNVDKKEHIPWKRLTTFFTCLYKSLKLGGKAVLQIYPEDKDQLELISHAAIKSGFSGGVVVDFPNSSLARKYYLVLNTLHEGKMEFKMIPGKQDNDESSEEELDEMQKEVQKSMDLIKKIRKSKQKKELKTGKFDKKSRLWILNKKERQRTKGLAVRRDTKYSGRRRKPAV